VSASFQPSSASARPTAAAIPAQREAPGLCGQPRRPGKGEMPVPWLGLYCRQNDRAGFVRGLLQLGVFDRAFVAGWSAPQHRPPQRDMGDGATGVRPPNVEKQRDLGGGRRAERPALTTGAGERSEGFSTRRRLVNENKAKRERGPPANSGPRSCCGSRERRRG
jgi:hypothetical protein